MSKRKVEYVDLNYDATFKELFKDTELLLDFMNSVVKDRVIAEVEIINSEVKSPGYARGVIFDILATCDDGSIVNIEMERLATNIMKKRTQYYWAKAFSKDLVKGDKFNKLNDTICINVLGRNIFKDERFSRRFVIKDYDTSERLDTSLDIYFLEIEKTNCLNCSDRLAKWLLMLKDVEESLPVVTGDYIFDKVIDASASMSESDTIWIDITKEADTAEKVEEGRKEGRLLGIKEGRQEGRQEGIREGSMSAKVEGVDNLIESGVCSLERALVIMNITATEYSNFKCNNTNESMDKVEF